MSWRIVSVSSLCKLDYKMDYLVIRKKEGITRIHLSEISVLIIESTAVALTAYLLRELDRFKICVIFCDEKRMPYAVLGSLYGGYDTALMYRKQAEWTEDIKNRVWQAIIKRKIQGQASILVHEKLEESALLLSYIEQVEPGDVTNREGHAAKVYFNALFGKEFSRESGDCINSALNFGYAVLLSAVAREITADGYCTQMGIFHCNQFNRLNLACDLMEPFRPFVDINVKSIESDTFGREEKSKLINNTFNQQIWIGNRWQFFLNALRIYVRSVLNALSDGEIEEICFPNY